MLLCPLQVSWSVSSGRAFYWPAWPPTCCSPASTCTTGGGPPPCRRNVRRVSRPPSRVEPSAVQKHPSSGFSQSFSCVVEPPWLLWISLIPERVAGLLTQTRRFLKTWNGSSQLFRPVLLKCAIKSVLFCQNCFALIPAPSQGSECCSQIQETVRHPLRSQFVFLINW